MSEKDKIKQYLEYKGISKNRFYTDTGLSVGFLDSGRSLGADKVKIIINKYPDLNMNWLILDEGPMVKDNICLQPDINDNDRISKVIPLIPQEAFAGYGTIEYPDLPIEEYYQISEFNKADFLIRVNGDSMVPKYHGGDIVACMKIKEVTFWQWHRIYAISTKSQGILIKRVEKDDNPDTLRLVSENPAYLPFSVKKEEIQDVALVLGAITLE